MVDTEVVQVRDLMAIPATPSSQLYCYHLANTILDEHGLAHWYEVTNSEPRPLFTSTEVNHPLDTLLLYVIWTAPSTAIPPK